MKFETTRWSMVVAAGDSDSGKKAEALAYLCGIYFGPLYSYVRRRGYSVEEAQDLTQDFVARLIEKKYLKQVKAERGRFRTFLLTAMSNFLANEWDRATAQKRGGGKIIMSLDFLQAESRFQNEPSHNLTPEKEFERKWALQLLERVLDRLREECEAAGNANRYELLKDFLVAGDGNESYAELARVSGTTENAIKTNVHRLRRRYRAIMLDEIAQTVATSGDVQEELHNLMRALS